VSERSLQPDHSQRFGSSFMTGVYLGVNAIADLYLLVEGPDCVHMKTQYVQGNHDWLSTLTSVSGYHRVANTALHPAHMSSSREEGLSESLQRMVEHPAVAGVALTSMPMAFITGADYGRLARAASQAAQKPVYSIPGRSLSGDWIDGYEEVQAAMAAQVEPPPVRPPADQVAIVGNLFDRNEEDHAGNVRELERLLRGLGLEPVSIWYDGGKLERIRAIRDASTIISLPYGRRAARQVAKRLGARLIETGLPFGLGATETWIRQLGDAFERRERAEQLIATELARVVPRLEWVVPYVFQNRQIGYVGDPFLLPGFVEYVRLLGASVPFAIITNPPTHAKRALAGSELGVDLLIHPKMKTFLKFLLPRLKRGDAHLLVTNNHGIMPHDVALLEFGFPSMVRHALYDRPFLGFSGAMAFADSMSNAMRMHEVRIAQTARQKS
jgi:nitrogenase molybdenum-iron protein alpha/beta subunit